jgi:hypothetical protein
VGRQRRYGYLMTRRIERAMALLRRGDLVTRPVRNREAPVTSRT